MEILVHDNAIAEKPLRSVVVCLFRLVPFPVTGHRRLAPLAVFAMFEGGRHVRVVRPRGIRTA
jgi:hypothetical protein